MRIIELNEKTKEWENFLSKYNNTLIMHTPEWLKFIQNTFPKTTTKVWAVEDSNELQIVFPFSIVKSKLFGSRIISSAFTEYGGPAGNLDSGYIDFLLSELSKQCSHLDYLEIRFSNQLEHPSLQKIKAYSRFVTKLSDAETVWKSISKHARKAVRKAEESKVFVRELFPADLDEIYNLYLQNMKQFGSPPFPKSFFENFWQIGKCFGAFSEDKLAAFLLGFLHKDRIYLNTAVSSSEFLERRVNDAVHWRFIKWGCDSGYKILDWGRVRENSGQFQFKAKWNSELQELNHSYLLWKSKKIPNLDPTDSKFSGLESIWKKLPVSIAKSLGPKIRERLGI